MAEQDKKISDLTSVSDVAASDLSLATIADPNDLGKFMSRKITNGDLAESFLNDFEFSLLLTKTANKSIIGALNEIGFKTLTGTLTSGSTTVTISDGSILETSMIDVWADSETPVSFESCVVSTGTLTLTFEARDTDLPLKVRVY